MSAEELVSSSIACFAAALICWATGIAVDKFMPEPARRAIDRHHRGLSPLSRKYGKFYGVVGLILCAAVIAVSDPAYAWLATVSLLVFFAARLVSRICAAASAWLSREHPVEMVHDVTAEVVGAVPGEALDEAAAISEPDNGGGDVQARPPFIVFAALSQAATALASVPAATAKRVSATASRLVVVPEYLPKSVVDTISIVSSLVAIVAMADLALILGLGLVEVVIPHYLSMLGGL